MKDTKTELIILVSILLLGFFLRSYGFSHQFGSSDSVELAYYSSCNSGSLTDWFYALFSTHSILSLFLGTTLIKCLGFLSLPITESVWNFIPSLFGSISILSVYILVKTFSKKTFPALIASLFLALFPLHVGLSRNIGHLFLVFPVFFDTLVLIAFYHYFKKPSNRLLLISSILLAASMLSHLLFPLSFIAIAYLSACFVKGNFREKTTESLKTLRRIYSKKPVLRASLILILLISTLFSLIYSFAGGRYSSAFHPIHYFINLFFYTGFTLLLIGVCAVLYSIKYILKFDLRGVFPLLFISYSLPFITVFDRCVTGHFILPSAYFVITTGFVLGELALTRKYRIISVALILLISSVFLLETLEVIYTIEAPVSLAFIDAEKLLCETSMSAGCVISPCNRSYSGKIYADNGIKSAAYWIRENTPDSDVVFSDATGGGGIERNILGYYVHRKYVCINDATDPQVSGLFKQEKNKLDVLLIRPENEQTYSDLFEGEFKKTVVVESEDTAALLIYTRKGYYPNPVTLDAKKYSKLYDNKYAKASQLTDCSISETLNY